MVFKKNKRIRTNYLALSNALKELGIITVSESKHRNNSYAKVIDKMNKKGPYFNNGANRYFQTVLSSLNTAKNQLKRRGMSLNPPDVWSQIAVWSLYPGEDKKYLGNVEYRQALLRLGLRETTIPIDRRESEDLEENLESSNDNFQFSPEEILVSDAGDDANNNID